MTGHAQVNGRNAISWDEKLKLDIWYVENQSIWIDFKIMLKTIKVVLIKENVNDESGHSMPKFTGDKQGDENGF